MDGMVVGLIEIEMKKY